MAHSKKDKQKQMSQPIFKEALYKGKGDKKRVEYFTNCALNNKADVQKAVQVIKSNKP